MMTEQESIFKNFDADGDNELCRDDLQSNSIDDTMETTNKVQNVIISINIRREDEQVSSGFSSLIKKKFLNLLLFLLLLLVISITIWIMKQVFDSDIIHNALEVLKILFN